MNTCLLCLQLHSNDNNFILISSPQWSLLNVLSIIEKHFWSIDNTQNIFGICHICWCQLSDFHTFYSNIEKAQLRYVENNSMTEKLSFQKPIYNYNLELETIQLPPLQIPKNDLNLNEVSDFATDKFEDIKIEERHISIERECIRKYSENPKRKRGRPRKLYNSNAGINKKPKGKRGRPRKYQLEKHENHTFRKNDSWVTYKKNIDQNTQTTKHNEFDEPGILKKAVKRGRPPKKRIEYSLKIPANNETIIETTDDICFTCKNISIPESDLHCSKSQDGESKNVLKNESKKLVNKKHALLKKRKRIQQHKALMRNYIATSVRCMKFLKK